MELRKPSQWNSVKKKKKQEQTNKKKKNTILLASKAMNLGADFTTVGLFNLPSLELQLSHL